MVDYWEKYNKTSGDFIIKITKLFNKLPPVLKVISIYAIAILGMLFMLWIIPNPEITPTNETTTTTTIESNVILPHVELPHIEMPEIEITSDYVGIKRVKSTQYPITAEQIMCNYIYGYNLTNITWSGMTCFRWENKINECMCISPLS